MLFVGNSSIQLHSLEQENSFGKKAIQHMLMSQMLPKWLWIFLIDMLKSMKSYLPFQLLRVKNQMMKDLLELISPQLLRFMFQSVEEVFKVPHLINLEQISLRCLRFNMKIKRERKKMFGKHHGVFQQEVSEQ